MLGSSPTGSLHLGLGSVSARPSALRKQPFVESGGGISLADWLELCPECPDVHLPQKRGHSWGSLSPQRFAFAGEARPSLPHFCRTFCSAWRRGEGPERPSELPSRRLPAMRRHWGPEIASMETEPGIVFPETSQSNLCRAGCACSCCVFLCGVLQVQKWGE